MSRKLVMVLPVRVRQQDSTVHLELRQTLQTALFRLPLINKLRSVSSMLLMVPLAMIVTQIRLRNVIKLY